MVQEYRNTWLEDEGYDYNYYLYVEEASKLISTYIEELGEEKYEKIQNAVNTSFSDEDIKKWK